MTQKEVDRAVAAATNESLAEIRRRGFIIADQVEIDDDDGQPRVVDWDAVDAQRLTLFP